MNEERVHKDVEIGDVIGLPLGQRRIIVEKDGLGPVAINPFYPDGISTCDCLTYERIVAGLVTGEYKVVGNIYYL